MDEFEIATVRFGLRDPVAYSSDAIFDLVNTVVNEVRKRAFSVPAIDLVCRRPGAAAEMRQAQRNGDECGLRY